MTTLTAEMIVDAVRADDVQISPDGTMVAFVVAPSSTKDQHPVSAIWIARTAEAGAASKLTAGTARDYFPSWAPDGKELYFLSDRAKRGLFQLFRIPLTGGEAEALTDWQPEPGIAAAMPLPDGKTVALLAIDPESDEEKKRKEERDDAEVYGECWPRQRLRLLDLESSEITTIDDLGERHIVEVAPSPDGARIAVLAWPTPELDYMTRDGEILVIDLADGAATTICHLPASGSDLRWGAAGRELLFLAHQAPASQGSLAVFAVAAAGGDPRRVSPDREACPVCLSTTCDGTPYVLMADGLDSWIGRLDLESRDLARLTDLPGDAGSLSVSENGATIALVRSLRDDLSSVWSGPVEGSLHMLTDLNPTLETISWGAQKPVAWRAPDGLAIEGLLILPAGASRADGPFPLMTLVHGGPYGRYADDLQLSWARWAQWLATAGYAILLPNPRGGSGRGNDFADRVAGAVGQEDWHDVEAGIDHLIDSGIADPRRLGIGGWSQGGFMTAWAVGQTRRFKLGIMGAGVSDWGMMLATGDLPHFEMVLGGSTAWDGIGPHRHDALSPISFAGTVTTPVLILHGAEDARVPVSQGRFFGQALRAHNAPCELVVYPREPHGIRERNHQLDLLRRVREWTVRWLGPGWTD
jgi:dipeptidyl aminopeptidase/acylaminoacyl peptidase